MYGKFLYIYKNLEVNYIINVKIKFNESNKRYGLMNAIQGRIQDFRKGGPGNC